MMTEYRNGKFRPYRPKQKRKTAAFIRSICNFRCLSTGFFVIAFLLILTAWLMPVSDADTGPAKKLYLDCNSYHLEEDQLIEAESARISAAVESYTAKQEAAALASFAEAPPAAETIVPETPVPEPSVPETSVPTAYDDIDLLCNMVEAEAGNQDLMGKRLVACVALNRVDNPNWPDTITGVITQPGQFASYADGGMQRFSVISDATREAVRLELQQRSYPALYYFTADGYSAYGTPYFQYGDHYFSTR